MGNPDPRTFPVERAVALLDARGVYVAAPEVAEVHYDPLGTIVACRSVWLDERAFVPVSSPTEVRRYARRA